MPKDETSHDQPSAMHAMTGGEAVIASLIAHGVDTIFGIPGVHTLPIYDAIVREPRMRHVLARHEQGAGFMAEGYARASGRVGVACTITGPGLTNIATPMASAHADSIPLLVVSSAVPSTTGSRLGGQLHEVKDQCGVMISLAGWTRVVSAGQGIPAAIRDAIITLSTGRPRGAYIEIPCDVLKARVEAAIPSLPTMSVRAPTSDAVNRAATLLRGAQRPIIIAGAGVTASGGNCELARLAEHLDAPVVLGAKSHDVLPTNHPLAIPTTFLLPEALLALAGESDVALVVGSKLGNERTNAGALPLPRALIHLDIDPEEIGRVYPVAVGMVADARLAMTALLDGLGPSSGRPGAGAKRAETVRTAIPAHAKREFGDGVSFLTDLQSVLSADTIVVADMTMLGYAAAEVMQSYAPRTFIHPAELCAIGCGLPTAIGAKVARPERSVIVLCGDGGFLLNVGELATAVQEGVHVVVVVFNDRAFTAVKAEQQRQYEGRVIATDLVGPDYVALAKSFGAEGCHVRTGEEFRLAVCEALRNADHTTTLIEVAL